MHGSLVRLVLVFMSILLLANHVPSSTSYCDSTLITTNLISTRGENGTNEDIWYINESFIIESAIQPWIINRSIIVGSGAKLQIINSSVKFNNTRETNLFLVVESGGELTINKSQIQETSQIIKYDGFSIIVAPGATLRMEDSTFTNFGLDRIRTDISVYTNFVTIMNCSFINNYLGLVLHNISNVSIFNNSFIQNEIGIKILNCENISLSNCTFENNSQSAVEVFNSGNHQLISLVNCTIGSNDTAKYRNETVKPNLQNSSSSTNSDIITLTTSKLELINTTYVEGNYNMDNHSSIFIKWYLQLLAVNKHDKEMRDFEITVVNNKGQLLFERKTDDHGYLNWLVLTEKQVTLNETINFTPFKISPPKGYTGAKEFEINITNTGEIQVIVISKEEEGEQDFWDSINDMCFCGSVFGVIFILLIFINFQLARRKAGVDKYKNISYEYKKGKKNGMFSSLGGEFITCSECGTQVTDIAKFCPHCGEYFDGEEYHCPGCNARLSASTESCPRCGKIFEDESKLKHEKETKAKRKNEKEKKKLFCSDCGAVVFEKDTHCPGCGAIFRSKKDETRKRSKDKRIKKSVSVKSIKVKKKSSGKDIKYARKITITEEAELEKKKAKDKEKDKEKELDEEDLEGADDTYMCSICGANVKGITKKCPKCGTEFV